MFLKMLKNVEYKTKILPTFHFENHFFPLHHFPSNFARGGVGNCIYIYIYRCSVVLWSSSTTKKLIKKKSRATVEEGGGEEEVMEEYMIRYWCACAKCTYAGRCAKVGLCIKWEERLNERAFAMGCISSMFFGQPSPFVGSRHLSFTLCKVSLQ